MASTIQLRAGTGSAVPSALTQGEIGINIDNGLLYYGSGSGNTVKKLESFTNITASGDISASGNIGIDGGNGSDFLVGDLKVVSNNAATPTEIRFAQATGITAISIGRGNDPTKPISLLGPVTASSDISASGNILNTGNITSEGTGSFGRTLGGNLFASIINGTDYFLNGTQIIDSTAAGLSSFFSFGNASTPITKVVGDSVELEASANVILDAGGAIKLDSAAGSILFQDSATTQLSLDMDGTDGAQILQLNVAGDDLIFKSQGGDALMTLKSEGQTEIHGNITASGNVSASGHISASKLLIDGIEALDHNSGQLEVGSDANFTRINGTTIKLDANVTASGDISSSGIVYTNKVHGNSDGSLELIQVGPLSYSNGEATIKLTADHVVSIGDPDEAVNSTFLQVDDVNQKITLSKQTNITGNISSSNTITGLNLVVTGSEGNITTTGTITTTEITASGNISASGNVYAGNKLFLRNKEVLEDGGTILGINEEADFSGGVQINRSNSPQPIIFYGSVTASGNISASGIVYGTNFLADSSLQVAGNRITYANDDLTFPDTGINVSGGHITASGNISASGRLHGSALSIGGASVFDDQHIMYLNGVATVRNSDSRLIINSAGTYTSTTLTGNLTSSGNISASGAITSLNLTATGSTGTVSGVSGSFDVLTGIGASTGLEVDGFVSASNQILSTTGSFEVNTNAITTLPFAYNLVANHGSELYVGVHAFLAVTTPQYYNKYIPPYDGKIKRISIGWLTAGNNPGDTTVRVRKGSDFIVSESADIVEQVTIAGCDASETYNFDFSSSFSNGDLMAFSVQQTGTDNNQIVGTVVVELDTSS